MKAGSINELISERSISGGSESESETSSTRGFILKVSGGAGSERGEGGGDVVVDCPEVYPWMLDERSDLVLGQFGLRVPFRVVGHPHGIN